MENLETLDPASSGVPSGAPPPPPGSPAAPSDDTSRTAGSSPAPATEQPSGASDQASEQVLKPPAELPPLQLSGPDGAATIEDLLRYIVEVKASDLHVKAGSPPTIRISGDLHPLGYPMILPAEAGTMAMALLVEEKERITLEEKGEVDFAYSMPGVGRFRVNVHRQRGSLGVAARRILPGAPNFADLQLPKVVEQLSREHRGLILVTGPTSSGKTTTCGAILKYINQTRRCHIVTIEDPIEILHQDEMSVVTQREVGQDTMGFHAALRAAMRQDPDVIFVGEIRDLDTISAAIQAAETGHLVLATLHTTDVVETINRIVDFFPAHQHKQVRGAIAASLVGVMTQRLLPKIGGGRAPALEIMVNNGRVRDCIMDGDRTHEIHEIVAESGFYGMQTFNQSLISLFRSGQVSLQDAKNATSNAHDFELALQREGLLSV
jgi:twitching motility protein PilT